jgi:hypothetical protein
MKQLYSILKVSDLATGVFNVAVCETLQREKDIMRDAKFAGCKVTTIIPARKWYSVFVHVVRDGVSFAKFSH